MKASIPDRAADAEALRAVLSVYAAAGEVRNDSLYTAMKAPLGIGDAELQRSEPVGRNGKKHCLATRRIRWYQQTLKRLQLLERVPGKRGVWRLKQARDKELTPAPAGMSLVGFSTELGVALWSSCEAFAKISEPVHLLLTSPPFPLAKPRLYGNPNEKEIVGFLLRALEPIVKNLVQGGSIVLDLGQDVFERGSPARSLWIERLTLALHSEFGLHLMDRIPFVNPCRPPGPMAWASGTRQQLNATYQLLLWFTNSPRSCFADNRRVLQPHTERHQRLLAQGGEKRDGVFSDGAYRLRAGRSFAGHTDGRIPRNVLAFPNREREVNALRLAARARGLPLHGATMPLRLAKFLIEFLSAPGHLVVDLFGGWGTVPQAAELTGRRWITTELMAEYVAGQALRLRGAAGFLACPELASHLELQTA